MYTKTQRRLRKLGLERTWLKTLGKATQAVIRPTHNSHQRRDQVQPRVRGRLAVGEVGAAVRFNENFCGIF